MNIKELSDRFGTRFVEVDDGALFQYEGKAYFLPEGQALHPFMKKLETLVEQCEQVEPTEDEPTEDVVEDVAVEEVLDTAAPIEYALRMGEFEPGSKWKKIEVLRIQNDVVISREDVSSRQSRHAALRVMDKMIVKYFARGNGTEQ